MKKIIPFNDALYDYLVDTNPSETDIQRRLREATAEMAEAELQISREQVGLLQFLAQLSGARKAIEIGVFTGYSSLAVALVMPADGLLVACDVSDEWTSIGRRYWKEAGVDAKIDLRIAPAIESVRALINDGQSGTFDYAFIDADKESYPDYYEGCLTLLRSGGVLALDNTLRGGRIVGYASDDEGAAAVDSVNRKAASDPRVAMCHLNVSDGMLLAMKR